jgi:hypothetical protein
MIQPKTLTMMMRTTMSLNTIAGIVAAAAAVRKLILPAGYFVGVAAASVAATATAAMLWTEED